MRTGFLLVLLTTFVSIIGCNTSGKKESINRYFDLTSLLKGQIMLLENKEAKLSKSGKIRDEPETIEIDPDSAFWSAQFEVFAKADLNKPVLLDAYDITEAEASKTSNLLITSYIPRVADDVEVKRFEVHYLDNPENIRIIRIWESQENELYLVRRQLQMEFDNLNGEIVLQTYQIRGFQKMQTRDTVFYDVEGRVLL